MLRNLVFFTFICSLFLRITSKPWFRGPLRTVWNISTTCLTPFRDNGLYALSHLDNALTLSYCFGGCVLKNGAVQYGNLNKAVVCKEKSEQGLWNNKWQIKTISDFQIQLYMSGTGYLKIDETSPDDVVPLYLDSNAGTTWAVENIASNTGYCVVSLKSSNGKYIGHGNPTDTPAWSVLRSEFNYPDLAVKSGGPGSPENSDAFKFVVEIA